jgi:hypothetical protein
MLHKAPAAVCSQIHTKHTTPSQHNLEILNVKPGGTQTNPNKRQHLKG